MIKFISIEVQDNSIYKDIDYRNYTNTLTKIVKVFGLTVYTYIRNSTTTTNIPVVESATANVPVTNEQVIN